MTNAVENACRRPAPGGHRGSHEAVEHVKNPFPGDFTSCCPHAEKIEQRSKLQHVDVLGRAPKGIVGLIPSPMQMQGMEQAGRTHESPNS